MKPPPRVDSGVVKTRCSSPRFATAVLATAAIAAAAQQAGAPERVVVTASGAEQRVFDTPYAVGVVDAQQLRDAGPMVNLSESMGRVPGIVVNNRNNYAQDLQINSRGFGARTTFGVRGLRLYTEGIPANGPDGQGQVTHFDLAGAQRIEVLRGPFSALFGSNSGGVIALVSAEPTERRYELAGDVGSFGLWQARATVEAPFDGGFSLRASTSRFSIDGLRPHSSAERTLGNVRFGWDGERDQVVVVLNAIDQPALDPLGLTRAQFDENPFQTTPQAILFDTRKEAQQEQAGVQWRHRFADTGALRQSLVRAYLGRRSVTQWQSIPAAVQASPTHPGGVIDFDRDYAGVDGRLVWRWLLAGDRQLEVVAGASADGTDEDRRGYENFVGSGADRVLGVTGNLRRDERNRVRSRDVYAQGLVDVAPRWTATLGVRHGRVSYDSDDRFVTAGNGDDSRSLDYSYTNPAAALQWRASDDLNLVLSAGRGFEAPTLNELAYRPDGSAGFNTGLQPQTSEQWELGAKWRGAGGRVSADAALFYITTDDEIGVASSSGGRSTFRNVGRTLRHGAEFGLQWQISQGWRTLVAASWLDATYRDTIAGTRIVAGNRIAGTLEQWGFAELVWAATPALEFGLEGRAQSNVPVNDANGDFAEGFGLLGLRARWQVPLGPGTLDLLGRVDNLADRTVIGSVIVNDANQRFFETAPGRNWLLSARWSAAF